MERNANRALLLLTVLLTLSASGDDINLLRLALPSAFALSPTGSFPLDDENTDFVKPHESPAPRRPLKGTMLPACRSAEAIQHILTSWPSALAPSVFTHHQLSGDSVMIPLRC
jgi:hypothetical protein